MLSLYTDFMFGSPSTEITGITVKGEEVVLMSEGSIAIG
jgi:leucyl aminopeptidase (aminopeptidase T)